MNLGTWTWISLFTCLCKISLRTSKNWTEKSFNLMNYIPTNTCQIYVFLPYEQMQELFSLWLTARLEPKLWPFNAAFTTVLLSNRFSAPTLSRGILAALKTSFDRKAVGNNDWQSLPSKGLFLCWLDTRCSETQADWHQIFRLKFTHTRARTHTHTYRNNSFDGCQPSLYILNLPAQSVTKSELYQEKMCAAPLKMNPFNFWQLTLWSFFLTTY